MYSCPSNLGIAKHLCGNGSKEHISRLKICYGYSIHNQAKAECSVLPLLIWRIQIWDSVVMLFSLTAFALESDCKNTHLFSFSQKYFRHIGFVSPDQCRILQTNINDKSFPNPLYFSSVVLVEHSVFSRNGVISIRNIVISLLFVVLFVNLDIAFGGQHWRFV